MQDKAEEAKPDGWDRTDPDFWSGRDYLRGATFLQKPFEADGYNDHEHCDLCFATLDPGDVGHETTPDSAHPDGGHYWLCETCFDAGRDRMGWRLVS